MALCTLCRLRYDANSPADAKRHQRVHEWTLSGLPYKPIQSDRVVLEEEKARVTVVTRESPLPQRHRAVRAFRLASREMGYTGSGYSVNEPPETDSHAFLLYTRGRLVGLFILARRTRWVEGVWNQEEPNSISDLSGWELQSRPRQSEPVWSVDFLWVVPTLRRQGYGRVVLRAAAAFLATPEDQFAWLPPFTPVGKKFIRQVRPQTFRAAK
jgi:GNAT superfamily N-acetyltransferase